MLTGSEYKDVAVPLSSCPHCGYVVDCATHTHEPERRPTVGDLTICIDCGEWCYFAEGLQLRKPTDDELIEVGSDPDCQQIRAAWQQMNDERRKHVGR